jgi:hypothetical protein
VNRALFAALGAVVCLLSFASIAAAQDSTQPGPLTVATAEYDLGDGVALECDPGVAGQPCASQADCDGECTMSCFATTVGATPTCNLARPTTELRARAYYPTLSQLAPGQALPLIVLVHGRHAWCYNPTTGETGDFSLVQWPCPIDSTGAPTEPIPNYRGYDYIANVLASHGYIVVSISVNAINSVSNFVGSMIPERAALIEQHLRLWSTFNNGMGTVGQPFDTQFAGHVDLQRVGTMGHSRGGDGVVKHFETFAASSPFTVRAVMPIAPTNSSGIINGVPLGLLMSYCDGDLTTLPGLKFFDGARYNDPADPTSKHVFFTRAANHNYFNMAWTPECWDSPGTCPLWPATFNQKPCQPVTDDPDCLITHDDWNALEISNSLSDDPYCHEGSGPRLTPAEQRAVGLAYTAAFFRYYIGQETVFGSLLRGDTTAPIAAGDEVFVEYQPPADRRLDLDRFDVLTELDQTTLSGQACASDADCAGGHCVGSVCLGDVQPGQGVNASFCAGCYPNAFREAHTDGALPGRARVLWTGSGQIFTVQLPPGARDVSTFDTLQFRVGVDYEDAGNPATGVRFTLLLRSGTAQAVASSDSQLGNNDLWKAAAGYSQISVLNTLRMPFSAFTATAGFDFANVSEVTFLFDQQAAGTVFFSDLQFVTEATCSDGIQNQGETGIDCGGPCPNACTCAATIYQAENMFHSTGGGVTDGWNIWSNGYISTNHTFGAGASSITVTARGQSAAGVAPHMLVSIGGAVVGNVFVTSANFAPHTFNFMTTPGNKEIRVTFDNDFYAPPQDRNLYVDKVEVACQSGSGCTEASAVDLGVPGTDVSVPVGGCIRVKDGYPSWWGTRPMKLENPSSASYPVPFTWTNACTNSGGTGTFTANWQAQYLSVASSACTTLIDLGGTGSGNITLRYWAN